MSYKKEDFDVDGITETKIEIDRPTADLGVHIRATNFYSNGSYTRFYGVGSTEEDAFRSLVRGIAAHVPPPFKTEIT